MTKADIVARIAQNTGMTKADTAEVLDALLETIRQRWDVVKK